MGGSEESQGLLAHRPESMANPGDEYGDITPIWRERVKRRLPYLNWRSCRVILLALVLFFVTAGFLVSTFVAVDNEVRDLRLCSIFLP